MGDSKAVSFKVDREVQNVLFYIHGSPPKEGFLNFAAVKKREANQCHYVHRELSSPPRGILKTKNKFKKVSVSDSSFPSSSSSARLFPKTPMASSTAESYPSLPFNHSLLIPSSRAEVSYKKTIKCRKEYVLCFVIFALLGCATFLVVPRLVQLYQGLPVASFNSKVDYSFAHLPSAKNLQFNGEKDETILSPITELKDHNIQIIVTTSTESNNNFKEQTHTDGNSNKVIRQLKRQMRRTMRAT